MKTLQYISSLAVLAMMTVGMVSCEKDAEPTSVARAYDIVCLASVGQEGSSYTLTKPHSNELITYHSREIFNTKKVKVGERFLLAYLPPSGVPYKSGVITPIGYAPIINSEMQWGYISKIDDWDRDPVYMLSAWLSQDYLNVRARLPYDTEPRVLGVLVDSLTIGNAYPDCYLVHQLGAPTETFDRNYYMSFDMAGLRQLPDCKGFNLILNNSNLKVDSFKFDLINN